MTSTGYHDTGEEWAQKWQFRQDLIARSTTISVLLYNDDTDVDGDGVSDGDQLGDADDLGAITTEPTGSAYARQTIGLDSTDISFSGTTAEFTVTYDTSDSSVTVDAYAVIVTFDATGDGAANDHLLLSDELEDASGTVALDLGNGNDQVTVDVSIAL